jgi:putative tryptophan/tyrosine transport system substrate-binding protein
MRGEFRFHSIGLLLLLASALAMHSPGTAAQAQVHRIGVIFWRIPVADLEGPNPRYPGAAILRGSLISNGWVPGKNIEIVWRTAEGDLRRADSVLEELVRAPVDVIVVSGNEIAKAAMLRTKTIPIVMLVSTLPVESGLVASLSRPGGNVTGMVYEAANLNAKRLAILKEAAPRVARVAFLHDGDHKTMSGGITEETRAAARLLGMTLLPYGVDTPAELERAMLDAVRNGADAVFVDTSLSAAAKDQPAFHALAERHRLPMMHTYANAVQTGGLMYYGPARGYVFRRGAAYIDRILRGGKPANMPLEQTSSYELIVNLKAAKAIDLPVPPGLIGQADELIR